MREEAGSILTGGDVGDEPAAAAAEAPGAVPAPPAPRPPWRLRDDPAVIEACVAGSEVAWREMVLRYSPLVHSIIRRYRFDEATVEDTFQEVFTICVRQLPRLRRQTALPKWFITTTHRVCRQCCGRAARDLGAVAAAVAESPAELAEMLERQYVVGQALRRLGGRCQQLLTMLYAGHGPVPYEQISARLGIPAGSIGPTRARCLAKLLVILEAMGGDEP